ncbi:hypothetical protein [Salinarimonas ramus]|uniref:Uncharacterized protein n=1 Tax=Salinarimonas ramus TaxID=690164 RepID=A0A917V2C3_9HYPH|nr:hypothetical protein [Salinarimonas ramus]GGK21407.1 hypothetical protein GCM10011322_05100 [Salinarimonas ramus]
MYPSALASFASFQRPWLDLWLASARLGIESQAVVGLRLFGMATGSVPAAHEAGLMVPEKLGALADAQYVIARAALTGRGSYAAEDVVRLYRRRVRANRRRLTRLG